MTDQDRKKQQSRQGEIFVESASEALYRCWMQCEIDGVPFPEDLAEAHAILKRYLKTKHERN